MKEASEMNKRELQKTISYYSKELVRYRNRHPLYKEFEYENYYTYNALVDNGKMYVSHLKEKNVAEREQKTIDRFYNEVFTTGKFIDKLLNIL